MEAELDKISEGKKTRLEVLTSFWKRFSKDLKEQLSKKEDKKIIKTESKIVKLNGKEYAIRIAKYGPVVHYEDAEKKTKYIPLKGYLQITKKEYTDIDEDDLKLLTSLPTQIGKFQDKAVMLHIGPYGLYIVYDKKNVKIPTFGIRKYMETNKFTDSELQGFIEYSQNNKKKPPVPIASDEKIKTSKESKSKVAKSVKSARTSQVKSIKTPKSKT